MKKLLGILVLIITLTACSNDKLSVPTIGEHQALITHIKEPTIAVIDLIENKVVHSQPFDFTIHSLVEVGENKVALSGKLENEVVLLDLKSGKVSSRILGVSAITDLYFEEERGFLIMSDARNNEVVLYDIEKGSEVARIKVADYPNAITVQGEHAYVVNGDADMVSVIDLSTYQVIHSFSVLERPTTIFAVDNYILVGGHGAYGELNEYVYLYEPITGKLVETIKVGLMPIAFYTDEYSTDVAVLCHGSNEMYVIDSTTFTVKKTVATGENPYYVTGDEKNLYVTALDGDNLFIFDRSQYIKKDEITLFSGPFGIVVGGKHDE